MSRLNLLVVEKVPIQLTIFGNNSTSCLLDLVKVKVQFGNRRFTVKLLAHDQTSMELNCPGIYKVTQQLETQGYQFADHYITPDALTGIEVLIRVDYFSCFIARQRRARGMNLFVTRNRRVITFGPLPKWVSEQQSPMHYRCERILCENDPDISQLWKREQIGITKEEISPSERETVSKVRSNIQNSESGYIVCLLFKSDTRPSTNCCTVRRQLNSLSLSTNCA